MGINYSAVYGMGVHLDPDQFDVEEIYIQMNDIDDEVIDIDGEESEIIREYIESIIDKYSFLEYELGGNMFSDDYSHFIFIKNPLKDLNKLKDKMDKLQFILDEEELIYFGNKVDIIGDTYVG